MLHLNIILVTDISYFSYFLCTLSHIKGIITERIQKLVVRRLEIPGVTQRAGNSMEDIAMPAVRKKRNALLMKGIVILIPSASAASFVRPIAVLPQLIHQNNSMRGRRAANNPPEDTC